MLVFLFLFSKCLFYFFFFTFSHGFFLFQLFVLGFKFNSTNFLFRFLKGSPQVSKTHPCIQVWVCVLFSLDSWPSVYCLREMDLLLLSLSSVPGQHTQVPLAGAEHFVVWAFLECIGWSFVRVRPVDDDNLWRWSNSEAEKFGESWWTFRTELKIILFFLHQIGYNFGS